MGVGSTEVISDFTATALGNDYYRIEFHSHPQFLNPELRSSPSAKLEIADSGHRFLRYIKVTTTDWSNAEIVYRAPTSQFPYVKEGFKLSVRLRNSKSGRILMCKGLFK
jgi:hypothetical protein